MRNNTGALAALTITICSLTQAQAATISLSDNFNEVNPAANWGTAVVFTDLAGTTAVTSYPASGGNTGTGGYASTGTTYPSASGQYEFAHLFQPVTYDPSTQGAITNLAMSIDTNLFQSAGANYVRFIVRQGSTIYEDTATISLASGWQNTNFANTSSIGFAVPFFPALHPDFLSGGTLEFGYLVGSNSYAVGDHLIGVDNFSVTITNAEVSSAAPEPGSLYLMTGGLLTGLATVGRRRLAKKA